MQIFQDLSTYKGRISRKTYWLYSLAIFGVQIAGNIVSVLLGLGLAALHLDAAAGAVLLVLPLAVQFILIVPSWRIALKRCHDRGHSGSYLWMLSIFNVFGLFWLFIELGFVKGTRGENQFGPDPAASFPPRLQTAKA
jgi:uncharacterized membrane protein YhaH (DUF805 family)